MADAFICDAVRTPFGRYGGSLASVRTDDLAAVPLKALVDRNTGVDWAALDDVAYGCANQAGEDNRNVARMALLLAGLPQDVPGLTINRLCASSLDAIVLAARAIKSGEASLIVAGGVESMSRAPFVIGKSTEPFSRETKMEDTTLGWRFVNPRMKERYGIDTMAETAENVAEEFKISRADQDAFALRSQQRAAAASREGRLAEEIVPVPVRARRRSSCVDEHPRPNVTLESLASLKPLVKPGGTVTAGNASGINDGAAALIVASEEAVRKHGLTPRARVVASAAAGVAPRTMGIGPVPAMQKVLKLAKLDITDIGIIELNEAFAAQVLAVLREHRVPDEAPHVNPNGGAIALGHPLGASGARLVTTATYQLEPHARSICPVHDVRRRRPGCGDDSRACVRDCAMRTQVGIVGAGPAGLVLSHLLHLEGVESIVLERRSREYVEKRVRAGVLEQSTVDLLMSAGVGDRLKREGLVHHGIELRFQGEAHRIPLTELANGRSIWIYGQQEVVKDLVNARLAAGAAIHYEVDDVSVHDVDSERPRLRATLDGARLDVECDFVAGCDGFHGICRHVIPAGVLDDLRAGISIRLGRHPRLGGAVNRRADLCVVRARVCAAQSSNARAEPVLRAVRTRRSHRGLVRRSHLGRASQKIREARRVDAERGARHREERDEHAQLCRRADAVRTSVPGRRCRAHRAADRRQGTEPCGS